MYAKIFASLHIFLTCILELVQINILLFLKFNISYIMWIHLKSKKDLNIEYSSVSL